MMRRVLVVLAFQTLDLITEAKEPADKKADKSSAVDLFENPLFSGFDFPSFPGYGGLPDAVDIDAPEGVPKDQKCHRRCWGQGKSSDDKGCMVTCEGDGDEEEEETETITSGNVPKAERKELSEEEKEAEEQIFAPLGMSFPSAPFGTPEDMNTLPQGVPEDHKCRKQCWGKDAEHKKGGCMMVCNPQGKTSKAEPEPMASAADEPMASAAKPPAPAKGRGKAKGVASEPPAAASEPHLVAHNELPQFKQVPPRGRAEPSANDLNPPSVELVNRPASSTSVMGLCLATTGASGLLAFFVKYLRAMPALTEQPLLGYSGEYVMITE